MSVGATVGEGPTGAGPPSGGGAGALSPQEDLRVDSVALNVLDVSKCERLRRLLLAGVRTSPPSGRVTACVKRTRQMPCRSVGGACVCALRRRVYCPAYDVPGFAHGFDDNLACGLLQRYPLDLTWAGCKSLPEAVQEALMLRVAKPISGGGPA